MAESDGFEGDQHTEITELDGMGSGGRLDSMLSLQSPVSVG